jgi:FkbM family methyltransferase
MSGLRDRLQRLLQEGGPPLKPLRTHEIVVYGAGNCGRSSACLAESRGFEVKAFLDLRAEAGTRIDGVPCYSPGSSEAHQLATAGIPVGVAIFNYTVDLQPIFKSLQEIGFTRVLSYYELHEHLQGNPHFWWTSRRFYRDIAADVLEGFDLFHDEESRRIYHDFIALRLTFDVGLLRNPDQTNHYFPRDLPAPRTPLRMIDGGAFDGDTIEMILAKGIPVAAIAAFEPDPENFEKLSQRVNKNLGQLGDVSLLPCGLGRETAICRFAEGQGGGSSLDSGGETFIQVVALDQVVPNFAPTFIKLDIEGAEPEALSGAEGLIARYRPAIAVCVYHKAEHLWVIPKLIRQFMPHCRLALRYHHFNGFDVVAYAIPNDSQALG